MVLTILTVAGSAAEFNIADVFLRATKPATPKVSLASRGGIPLGGLFDLEYGADIMIEAGPSAAQAGKSLQPAGFRPASNGIDRGYQ